MDSTDDLRKEEDIEVPPALEKDIIELPPHASIEEVVEEVEKKHEVPGEV